MIRLLSEILQLPASREVLLLSGQGDVLYRKVRWHLADSDEQSRIWKKLLSSLGHPQVARFQFDQGLYYLHHVNVGYVVVGLENDNDIEKILTACQNVKVKVGESRIRKDFLLQILDEADYKLKPQVVDELAKLSDREVARRLIILLDRYLHFPEEIQTRLLFSICQGLGNSSSLQALAALNRFVNHYADGEMDEMVDRAARVSIKQLELELEPGGDTDLLSDSNKENNLAKTLTGKSELIGGQEKGSLELIQQHSLRSGRLPSRDKSSQISEETTAGTVSQGSSEKQRVKKLLAEGRKEDAVAIIMKYIKAAARQKLFDKAERLRNTLIQIDSMMLTEIIQAAEIIEAEKTASIQADHLVTWKPLVEMLNQEEFSALYHSMVLKRSKPGEILFRQGEFKPQLIFVNSGKLKVYANAVDKETYLKTVDEGEVLGADTFFEASVWTVNVQSSGAEFFVLPRKNLDQLVEKYPAIESKLIDFCVLFVSPEVLFRKTGRSRRESERKNLSGRVAFSLTNRNGLQNGVNLKGDLFDISNGGVSFCVRISQKRSANKLFGSGIKVVLPMVSDGRVRERHRLGKVVAIKGHHVVSNEYSVHVQFTAPLSQKELNNTVQLLNIV